MLTRPIELGKQYRLRQGKEVTISRIETCSDTGDGMTIIAFWPEKGQWSDERGVAGNGKYIGKVYAAPQEDPYDIVEEVNSYQQEQLDLFE